MHNFYRLDVWVLARQLASAVYNTTKDLPREESYGLVRQMRRAAVSIASNIAEGASRGTSGDFRRFLRIAAGSASELETQVYICSDTGMIPEETAAHLSDTIQRIRKMLYSLEHTRTP